MEQVSEVTEGVTTYFLEGFLQKFRPFQYSSPVVQPTNSRQPFGHNLRRTQSMMTLAPATLCGAEVEGALTSIRVSTAQCTTVLSLLQT